MFWIQFKVKVKEHKYSQILKMQQKKKLTVLSLRNCLTSQYIDKLIGNSLLHVEKQSISTNWGDKHQNFKYKYEQRKRLLQVDGS